MQYTSLRPPCDDYCPIVSAVCCGLPEVYEVYEALAETPPRVWMCHSNKSVPCVTTGLDKLPEGAIAVTNSEDFYNGFTIPVKPESAS